ncbi:Cysteine-rich flanking region, C-terminal,Leucine-rich repeat,Leucine-rich repeat domain, L [Cinara cedri]|uniref:Cysteine-rich flanking region, C-terminal,Leucine-rich repeat,Leucine-rich repeat domain, L n=1 Tax=Cinara cedri TaxID=506608 RepID=A0A5E4M5E7_9HEMI|nr:Cysteine-rich flanking region, C-terminal,Leucine-rich repeat,Leucine-rich repeat domain, L [Cinara cedri]
MLLMTTVVTILAVLQHTCGQQQQHEDEQTRETGEWKCPEVRNVSCACDLPHTLRCTGGKSTFETVARALRNLSGTSSISLLDCTVQNVGSLPSRLLEGVSLHGLVVSSGEIKSVSDTAFEGLRSPLQALGLPNNQLERVPSSALAILNGLERLDLSHNRLHSVHNNSFKGSPNLTFLDLSNNSIHYISPDSFVNLPFLKVLRLQNNLLTSASTSHLQGLRSLVELDLSSNLLTGQLGPSTLPRLPNLQIISLAHNQLNSVRRGSFAGLEGIVSLTLNHNQIDVLEDHGFRAVPTLLNLDLANNRIVAVSSASLAHLTKLKTLDLSHNFLRSLTSDLIAPLKSIQQLKLDDNDISIVAEGALNTANNITSLSLSDNPLNCDCSLLYFATWLSNHTAVCAASETAVCATPPSLENGLLQDLPTAKLICGGEDSVAPPEGPLASLQSYTATKITLRSYQFDGTRVSLGWSVIAPVVSYYCNALIIYEDIGNHEVLLDSKPVRCNSSQLPDAKSLTLSLSANELQPAHSYRYCVMLVEGYAADKSDDSGTVLGCSDIIALVPNANQVAPNNRVMTAAAEPPEIQNLTTSFVSPSSLFVAVHLSAIRLDTGKCTITVSVYTMGRHVAHHRLNCTASWITVTELPAEKSYQVCASIGSKFPKDDEETMVCTSVDGTMTDGGPADWFFALLGAKSYAFLLSATFTAVVFLFVLLIYRTVCRACKKPVGTSGGRANIQTHQCFLPVPPPENGMQRPRYVKLQATTVL